MNIQSALCPVCGALLIGKETIEGGGDTVRRYACQECGKEVYLAFGVVPLLPFPQSQNTFGVPEKSSKDPARQTHKGAWTI